MTENKAKEIEAKAPIFDIGTDGLVYNEYEECIGVANNIQMVDVIFEKDKQIQELNNLNREQHCEIGTLLKEIQELKHKLMNYGDKINSLKANNELLKEKLEKLSGIKGKMISIGELKEKSNEKK